ncbi:hypothetical protein B0H13DRAFT_2305373 [Mycena leptocephala]|nr:hypothetical protein B0H13DRAFT_2305373 [Mycena leptocephala]
MHPRSRTANRFVVLSSEEVEPDDADNPTADNLPPSDPPEPFSGSESDSRENTPIPQLPSLLPFLRDAAEAVSPLPSSPLLSRSRRVYRARTRSPLRGSSLPPEVSPRIVADVDAHKTSDDIMFTPRTEKKHLTERAQAKRRATLEAIRAQQGIDAELEQVRLEEEARAVLLARTEMFDRFLDEMHTNNVSVAHFMDYVFNPANKFDADWRWKGFFAHRPRVERIFGYWTTSKYNATTRAFIDEWAKEHVAGKVYTEARSITNSGILSRAKKVINEQFFLDFNLTQLTETLRTMAPFAFTIFDAFSTTARQLSQVKPAFRQRKEIMKGTAALTLLWGRSQKNNYTEAVTGTYLAATGGQRQHYSVLGLYGFAMGYTSIISRSTGKASAEDGDVAEPVAVGAQDSDSEGGLNDIDDIDSGLPALEPAPGKNKKTKKKKKSKKRKRVRGPGLFSSLHDACMTTSRALAATRSTMFVYDNVNLMNRIAEQILGRKSAQENGTCATLIPLHNAKLEHLLTSELDKSILSARPLTVDDICLNADTV